MSPVAQKEMYLTAEAAQVLLENLDELAANPPAKVTRKAAIDAAIPRIREMLDRGFEESDIVAVLRKTIPDVTGPEIRRRVHNRLGKVGRPRKIQTAPAKAKDAPEPKKEPDPAKNIPPLAVVAAPPAPAKIEVEPVADSDGFPDFSEPEPVAEAPKPAPTPVEKPAAPTSFKPPPRAEDRVVKVTEQVDISHLEPPIIKPPRPAREAIPAAFEAPAAPPVFIPPPQKFKFWFIPNPKNPAADTESQEIKSALKVLGARLNSRKNWYEVQGYKDDIVSILMSVNFDGTLKFLPLRDSDYA